MAKPIQFSKCVFNIRCSYVLLDLAGLKSSLGEKYMVFTFMVMNLNTGHLSYVLLFFSLTKVKRTITVAYLPLKEA